MHVCKQLRSQASFYPILRKHARPAQIVKAATYFLHYRGVLVYIGTTRNLRQRIQHHQCELKRFDAVYFIPTHSLALERELIRYFKPRFNVRCNPDQPAPSTTHTSLHCKTPLKGRGMIISKERAMELLYQRKATKGKTFIRDGWQWGIVNRKDLCRMDCYKLKRLTHRQHNQKGSAT
jgi:hypothetical protein